MPSRYFSAEQRRQIELRANRCCEYCKSPKDYASHSFHVEHITPISLGGTDSLSNLALAYGGYNLNKSSKVRAIDIASKSIVSLFNPRKQVWSEHCKWSADRLEAIGVTPCGRATVETLKINRLEAVNLRKLLLLAGLHPPDES